MQHTKLELLSGAAAVFCFYVQNACVKQVHFFSCVNACRITRSKVIFPSKQVEHDVVLCNVDFLSGVGVDELFCDFNS